MIVPVWLPRCCLLFSCCYPRVTTPLLHIRVTHRRWLYGPHMLLTFTCSVPRSANLSHSAAYLFKAAPRPTQTTFRWGLDPVLRDILNDLCHLWQKGDSCVADMQLCVCEDLLMFLSEIVSILLSHHNTADANFGCFLVLVSWHFLYVWRSDGRKQLSALKWCRFMEIYWAQFRWFRCWDPRD